MAETDPFQWRGRDRRHEMIRALIKFANQNKSCIFESWTDIQLNSAMSKAKQQAYQCQYQLTRS